jgi:NAD(P)-dependent dehydrogenase (short-subunit alcohol dehydrogenase family)
LGKNLAKAGIRVNGFAPGPIWSPLIPSTFENVKKFGHNTPMGRDQDVQRAKFLICRLEHGKHLLFPADVRFYGDPRAAISSTTRRASSWLLA